MLRMLTYGSGGMTQMTSIPSSTSSRHDACILHYSSTIRDTQRLHDTLTTVVYSIMAASYFFRPLLRLCDANLEATFLRIPCCRGVQLRAQPLDTCYNGSVLVVLCTPGLELLNDRRIEQQTRYSSPFRFSHKHAAPIIPLDFI